MIPRDIEPNLFIIFGGSGDLSSKKLIPALANLRLRGQLPESTIVLGIARKDNIDDKDFRLWAHRALESKGTNAAAWCDKCLYYQPLRGGSREDYLAVKERIETIEREHNLTGNRTIYLALPHISFPSIINNLGATGMNSSPGWTRIVIEKPFGHDLDSAIELNELIHRYFDESQIYRIDHYLGKETVQNLLVFRFANAIFESQWNRDHIESVEITMSEDIGTAGRATYYERSGALRDMVQNHITQLLTLVAMGVPTAYEAEDIRYEKIKVLRSISPIQTENIVFGQYAPGKVNGQPVNGYRQEQDIPPESKTETFVAMKLYINNWRWQGVPFSIRTGKRMPQRLTQIAVKFRSTPVCMFKSLGGCLISNNLLLITLQPNESFALFFDIKKPGEPLDLQEFPLKFSYKDAFGPLPDAYETLILEILSGDQTLFVHSDEVEASWKLYTSLLEENIDVLPYEAGTWGPPEADRLISKPKQV